MGSRRRDPILFAIGEATGLMAQEQAKQNRPLDVHPQDACGGIPASLTPEEIAVVREFFKLLDEWDRIVLEKESLSSDTD